MYNRNLLLPRADSDHVLDRFFAATIVLFDSRLSPLRRIARCSASQDGAKILLKDCVNSFSL